MTTQTPTPVQTPTLKIEDIQHLTPSVFFPHKLGTHLESAGVVTVGQILRLAEKDVDLLSHISADRARTVKSHLETASLGFSTALPLSEEERRALEAKPLSFYFVDPVEQLHVDEVLRAHKISSIFDLPKFSATEAEDFAQEFPFRLNRCGFTIYHRTILVRSSHVLGVFLKSISTSFSSRQ